MSNSYRIGTTVIADVALARGGTKACEGTVINRTASGLLTVLFKRTDGSTFALSYATREVRTKEEVEEALPQGLTERAKALLVELKAGGGMLHVQGARVGVARRLAKAGLVHLRDDGRLGPGGNADGERWVVELVEPTPRATNGSAEIVTPPLDPAAPRS